MDEYDKIGCVFDTINELSSHERNRIFKTFSQELKNKLIEFYEMQFNEDKLPKFYQDEYDRAEWTVNFPGRF